MSVMNRKLFNREARDELRRKGGIMASSEPMMQASGYETGGAIDAFIQGGKFLQDNPFILDYLAKTAAGTGIAGLASVPAFFLNERRKRKKKIRDYMKGKAEGGVVGYENGGRISDELMQYLASLRPRLQGGAVPGGSFPTNTVYDPNPNPDPQIPVSPTYDMTQFGSLDLPKVTGGYQGVPVVDFRQPEIPLDDIGDIIAEEKGPTSDEGIRARVAESAAQGKGAAEIADFLGTPLKEVLDVGVGLIGAGLLEGTAFALDVASAIESGIADNRAGGEMLARGARNVKGFSDETFYKQGDSLPRVSSIFPSEEDAAEQERRDAIRRESLANIADAQDKQILSGVNTGIFADTGESIPVASDSLRRNEFGLPREAINVGRTFPTGSRLNPFGRQLNRLDDMTLYSSDPDLTKRGVASILPGVVNEPPAEVPQTMKELISDQLVNIGVGGVKNIGNLFESGVDKLQGFISGDDTTPASPNPMSLGEREAETDPSVVEELTTTAGELTSKLTKQAQNAIDTVKNKLENPKSAEETPNIEEAPTLENNEPLTEVQLDNETAKESIVTEKTANDLFDGDTTLSTTITKLTKGDVGNMKDDLFNVTDDESFESYVSKYVKQYQKLFKEDEDQIRKDKGFALAIFGSVYGSTGDWGQASAAMIDMLRGDKATRQARADKVKMLAINSAADRKAADLRYKREIDVAKARGGGSLFGKRTDPMTQMYRTASDLYAGGGGEYDTYEDALAAAKKIVETDYGVTLGTTADIEKPDPDIQKAITNQRENKVSDEVIKKQLEEAGINTSLYGF